MRRKLLLLTLLIPMLLVGGLAFQLAASTTTAPASGIDDGTDPDNEGSSPPQVIVEPTSTPRAPAATQTATPVPPTATATPRSDRNNCAEIFGTDYHSPKSSAPTTTRRRNANGIWRTACRHRRRR